jgi:hypothetical protein
MMSALASLMGRVFTYSMFETRARFILSKPGAFHLLFSITRAPWRGIVGLLELVHSRHHLDLN